MSPTILRATILRPTILHSVDSLAEAHGGPSRSIVALAEAQAQNQAQARTSAHIRLLTRTEPAGSPIIAPDPSLVGLTQITGATRIARFRALQAAIRAHPPTLLHDNALWLPANLATTGTARALGIPHVISPHGSLSPWALAWHPWRKRAALALYQQRLLITAAGLIASAEPERAHIRAQVPRARIAIIPNGVDVPTTRPPKPPASPRTLLFLSRLHPVKNLPALIAAWAQIITDPAYDQWHLRIAGPDEAGHAATLAPLIAALGPTARITLTGPVPDAQKAQAFAAAEAFILPSLSENFGIAVAEALAHGLPAITTTGTPWSDLPAAHAGWHTAPDPASLAHTLRDALSRSPQDLAAMGARGRTLVETRYSWPRIAAQTLSFYEWLLHGGPTPDFVEA